MPNAVLMAESRPEVAGRLRRSLAMEGFGVDLVSDGRAVLAALRSSTPDIALIDRSLPGLDGLEVTQRIRAAGIDVPIIIITTGQGSAERIVGLNNGADDYFCTSAPFEELLARIRAQLRRSHRRSDAEILRYGPLWLDTGTHEVWVGGEQIHLTIREFDLLALFLRCPCRVLRRDDIYDRVWGYNYGAESNVLEVHVSALRHKLAAAHAPPLIHTVRGIGYILRG